MKIELGNRTEETVAIYYEKSKNEQIRKVLPQKAQTLQDAISDYRKTLCADATSYGRTIVVDNQYIGDIWCYCMNMDNEPNAMISYCIFEEAYWGKGIATKAVELFVEEIIQKYQFKTLGAFTFSSNIASVKVLEKNDFIIIEEVEEDGVKSKYLQFEKK